MQYFVYVRYLSDDVKKVTTSNNVRNFHPEDDDDFTPGDTYLVYWDGDDTTKGGYYDADLLHVTGKLKCFYKPHVLLIFAHPIGVTQFWFVSFSRTCV